MLEAEEKGYNSDTLTRQPFRLSKKWKKTFTPNIDLTDNHLINHNLINHNLSRISGTSKEEENSCSSAIIKSESIESDLDIRPLHTNKEKMESFKNAFKPQCPDFEPTDCPFSCCVFFCLLIKHRKSKKRNEKNEQKDKKSLKYSSNSIQSNGNTISTIQEDDLYNKSNLPTRTSSQTNLNNRGSTENLPEQQIDQPVSTSHYDELNDELKRFNKHTQV